MMRPDLLHKSHIRDDIPDFILSVWLSFVYLLFACPALEILFLWGVNNPIDFILELPRIIIFYIIFLGVGVFLYWPLYVFSAIGLGILAQIAQSPWKARMMLGFFGASTSFLYNALSSIFPYLVPLNFTRLPHIIHHFSWTCGLSPLGLLENLIPGILICALTPVLIIRMDSKMYRRPFAHSTLIETATDPEK